MPFVLSGPLPAVDTATREKEVKGSVKVDQKDFNTKKAHISTAFMDL